MPSADTTCPACGNHARLRGDGTLGKHRSNERTLLGSAYLACKAWGKTPATVKREMAAERSGSVPHPKGGTS
jgi:hypothetical protein